MEAIKLDAYVDHQGILKLEIPLELRDTDVEIVLVVQRKTPSAWHPTYFDRTAGSLADDPIETCYTQLT